MAVKAQRVVRPAPRRLFTLRRPAFGTAALLTAPVSWLVLFFLVPVVFIALYSVDVLSIYRVVGSFDPSAFSLDAWKGFLDGGVYLDKFWTSIWMAAVVSIGALVAAYPIAYFLALVATKRKYVLLLLILSPFLVSYFLRVLAWKVILGDQGVINTFAYWVGLRADGDPIPQLLYSRFSVMLVLAYVWIPFVALPIFVALENLDRRLLEASADLGASRRQTFIRVTLPLSLPGVIAAFIFVFIPTIGEYFTPLLIGGTNGTMFGNVIADQFGQSQNWLNGSVFSFFLLVVVAVLMALFARFLTLRRVAAT
ncbi:MAG: ABC transporter permease [Actinomycetota bacterium]|nr:ABC transporter permease [Actinomycetota bacterium]